MNISVIVAVYNVEQYLEHCIASLTNQNYTDVEFILVDDGSSDKSSDICDKAKQADSRIKVIHKANGGLSDARNAGLDIATGQYIMFIDGDDAIDLNTLNILSSVALETDSELIQFGFREMTEPDLCTKADFNGQYECITNRHEMFVQLYNHGGIASSACTKFIKRSVLKDLRFKKSRFHEDEYFTTELLLSVKSVTYASSFTPYQYIKRSGSIINGKFNPKRAYDISDMFEKRIEKLNKIGFHDLVELTQNRYFSNLFIFYVKSCFSNNRECSKFLKQKITYFPKFNVSGLTLEMRIAKIWPTLMLPILFGVRLITNRKL